MCEHKAQAEDPRAESADHLRGLLADTTEAYRAARLRVFDLSPDADLDHDIICDARVNGGTWDLDARPHQAAFENADVHTGLHTALAEGRAKNGTAEAGHG